MHLKAVLDIARFDLCCVVLIHCVQSVAVVLVLNNLISSFFVIYERVTRSDQIVLLICVFDFYHFQFGYTDAP